MQSESNNNLKPTPGDLQDQDDPRLTPGHSIEPDPTPKIGDGVKNKIHPEINPPQVILGEAKPIAEETTEKAISKESLNEKTPLIGTPLSSSNEKV